MIEKTIKLQRRLDKYARNFCDYLVWDTDYEFRWVADEIGWVFHVNDMFFSVEEAMLYSMFSPEDILDIYFSYLECEWEHKWKKINLKNFIKHVWLNQPKEELNTKEMDEKIKNSFEVFIQALDLPEVNFERKFLMCLHTWEIIFSKYEWEFVESSDRSCFIDQTEHYIRIGWEEWKDFIFMN